MSPKPPPAGMVLPNVLGLQSMLSFGRSTSGKLDRSNSGRDRAQVSKNVKPIHYINPEYENLLLKTLASLSNSGPLYSSHDV